MLAIDGLDDAELDLALALAESMRASMPSEVALLQGTQAESPLRAALEAALNNALDRLGCKETMKLV